MEENYLKVYDVELVCQGPVYIGSGQSLTKKEYIIDKKKKRVIIPQFDKMYNYLYRMGKLDAYEAFLMSNRPDMETLGEWLELQHVPEEEIEGWISSEIAMGEAISDGKDTFSISSFIRDGQKSPYIPGSSLKGMLRTVLLANHIHRNKDAYVSYTYDTRTKQSSYEGDIATLIEEECDRADSEINKWLIRCENHVYDKEADKNTGFRLKKISKRLNELTKMCEAVCFNTLHGAKNGDRNFQDAKNDYMSGIIVSDSEPLSEEDIVLCQKIDTTQDGGSNSLNALRECLKPGTKVRFTISVDTKVVDMDTMGYSDCKDFQDVLNRAITYNANNYYKNFLAYFENSEKHYKPSDNTVWLGGGAGFGTKTVVYSLFEHKKAVDIAKTYFAINHALQNINKKKKDKNKNVDDDTLSPHMLKLTVYQGEYLEFGRCLVGIKEKKIL